MIKSQEVLALSVTSDKGPLSFTLQSVKEGDQSAFSEVGRKIYVVHDGRHYLYVGEAKSSIKVRMARGFRSYNYYLQNEKGLNGYKGYKWIGHLSKEALSAKVYVTVLEDTEEHNHAFAEVVEAELVYLIRARMGYWPKEQNEIHFNNEYNQARVLAVEIFDSIENALVK
jgi:Uri superfamily endonuclease